MALNELATRVPYVVALISHGVRLAGLHDDP
jgi:hypothetical protein